MKKTSKTYYGKARSSEIVENTVYSYGSFQILTIVKNSSEYGSEDSKKRRDAFSYQNYESQKYENASRLDRLSINNAAFLAFRKVEYDDEGKRTNHDIWFGYKAVSELQNELANIRDIITDKTDEIWKNGKVTKAYKDAMWTVENTSGTAVGFRPIVCQSKEDEEQTYNGIEINLIYPSKSKKKEEEYYEIEISADAFITMIDVLLEYNLLNDGRLTTIEGMCYQILDQKNFDADVDDDDDDESSSSRFSLKNRGRSRPALKTRGRGSRIVDDDDDDDEEELDDTEETDEDDDEEEEEETTSKRKTVKKKTSSTKSTKSKGRGRAKVIEEDEDDEELDAILEAGEDDDFSLEDDDEDGEEL